MAKTLGLKDYHIQLNKLVEQLSSDEVIKAAEESWSIIGDQIRQNAVSNNFVLTGLLIDPRTILTHAGVTNRDGKKGFFAEAGVFKDDSAMASYPHPSLDRARNPKSDIPSATVAYWLEFGVQPHYTVQGIRARKVKPDAKSGVGFHGGIKPTPFISSAYDTKLEDAHDHLSKSLGALIDRVTK